MSKEKLGFSTGKGFIEAYKDENGVLQIGDCKIPTHKTILNTPKYHTTGETICTIEDWQEGVTLLEITYAVDADHKYIKTTQMKGSHCDLYTCVGVYGYAAHVYMSGNNLVWGAFSPTEADPVIYRIDKVIV